MTKKQAAKEWIRQEKANPKDFHTIESIWFDGDYDVVTEYSCVCTGGCNEE